MHNCARVPREWAYFRPPGTATGAPRSLQYGAEDGRYPLGLLARQVDVESTAGHDGPQPFRLESTRELRKEQIIMATGSRGGGASVPLSSSRGISGLDKRLHRHNPSK